MNNSSGKYEILCYGDSNTWGTVAKWHEEDIEKRYGRDSRWTCILQKELGDEYAVNEEGLGGRTTIYTANSDEPYKNGMYMLEGCLHSHRPLDLVIILLGTNDLHLPYKISEEDLGKGIREMISFIKGKPKYGPGSVSVPQILIIAPTYIEPSSPAGRTNVYAKFFCEYGEKLSRKFPEVYKKIADETGCYFLNAQDYAQPDPGDGVHITPESHVRLGKAIAVKVRQIKEETFND